MKQFDELRFRELVGEYLDHAEADMATEVAEQYFDELEKENRKMAEEIYGKPINHEPPAQT